MHAANLGSASWSSTAKKKATWDLKLVTEIAKRIYDKLPEVAREVIAAARTQRSRRALPVTKSAPMPGGASDGRGADDRDDEDGDGDGSFEREPRVSYTTTCLEIEAAAAAFANAKDFREGVEGMRATITALDVDDYKDIERARRTSGQHTGPLCRTVTPAFFEPQSRGPGGVFPPRAPYEVAPPR